MLTKMKPKKVSNDFRIDLLELSHHLRKEHIFVSNERIQMQKLNEKVLSASSRLFNSAWITREQRFSLDRVICEANIDLLNSCNNSNRLECVHFIDAYKKLGTNESIITDLFAFLRKNPQLLALSLISEEKANGESVEKISKIIMSSIYSHCLLNEDKVLSLQMMKQLISSQMALSDNPRRILRYNRCAFSHIYRIFCDEILDAKPFLTAALYEPVMQVLAEDDLFLDIDPNRAAVRFAPSERIRHFGKEGTQLYNENLQKYRIWTINKLASFVIKFIEGIQSNIFCFPQSLSWIVKQLYNIVIKNKSIEVREIGAMCADLIFSFFICPAILNPDLLGITDAHVSHIARFNLQQIAQIIQILALSKWEEIDPKLDDLYSKFQKDSISRVLDHILEKCSDELPQENNHMQCITRSCVLISETELKIFISFLNRFSQEIEDENIKKSLCEILDRIPEKLFINTSERLSANNSTNNSNIDTSPRMRRSILNRVTRKGRITDTQKHDIQQTNTPNSENLTQTQTQSIDSQTVDVLVIPLGNSRECPGMLSEEKVLKLEQQKRPTKVRMNLDMLLTQNNNEETESMVSAISGSEKRTRFSLSQDQDSIVMSDNLEAISEAASNHSVESSIDLENENDNMSDMVSANVSSGRGTPNVSGRDTPSSHSPNQSSASSDEEVEVEPMVDVVQPSIDRPPAPSSSGSRVLNRIPITQPNRPNNRDDIEDKFGKFDIKPVAAVDETKSLLSDTWSTDVLGSDSEAFEQTENPTANASSAQTTGMNVFGFPVNQSQTLQMDSSETASQSDAWSTDVLTSDTERLQEFDPEDSASVTKSEPEEENFNNKNEQQYNASESPKNGTLKQRNFKMNANSSNNTSNVSQEMNENSVKSNTILRSKTSVPSISFNAMKINSTPNVNRIENERNSFSESTLTENSDNSSDNFSISLSPTLSSHNMQSLGRLSFDVRKFDEDMSVRNLIHENVFVNLKSNGISNNGSLVAELLTLDLSQTKINKQSNQVLSNSLIDFEMEIFSVEKSSQPIKSALNDCVATESINELINFGNDLETEENVNTMIASTVESRFSYNSISSTSTNSSITSANIHEFNSNKLISGNNASNYESTGAIPKTPKPILTSSNRLHNYESNDEELNRHSTNRKGFFKLSNFKSTFREKMRSFKDNKRISTNDDSFDAINETSKGNKTNSELNDSKNETSDEILAKYRAKSSLQNSICDETGNKTNFITDCVNEEEKNESLDEMEILNITKKKIRRALSSIDMITLPAMMSEKPQLNNQNNEHEIVHILKVLLAESINLRHSTHTVLLSESLRSIQSLDENSCQKLFWSLREDYQRRTVYIAYLTRCRQQLLSTLAYFESILEHIEREKYICSLNLVTISVKQFLEKKERSVQLFIKKFQSLIAADEKTQLVDKFLSFLSNTLNNDSQWQAANEEQIEMAKQVIERHVMSQIYIHALYPNGDGDVLRDQILHQHMQNLSLIITPNHKDLGIPKVYHSESPWPSAQAEILTIGAYKTPRDKVKCVAKTCTNIMNLLSFTTDKSVPAADDLMPVLVYVLIKANPPSLLSTVQYVNSFYDKHFEGEDAYWWTQFCSAIEFIKTMD